jgi:glycosyltransferase involved in cell wall biosynthesis
MRVLFCNKYNFRFSGTESYLFDLMDLLRHRGHETALFSMADERGAPTPFDSYFLPNVDFKLESWPLRQARLAARAIYSTDARRRLGRLIDDFRPDVAHVRNIYHHLSPSILWELRARKVPVVYHINDFKLLCPSYNSVSRGDTCERCAGGKFWRVVTEGCYGRSRRGALVLAAEAYTHRWLRTYEKCVDVFLAPSEFARARLIAAGLNPSRSQVLPHFQQIPPATNARLADAVLCFGRLSVEKGIADLLRAAQAMPYISVQIAGDGPERQKLERFARQWTLQNVRFLGHLQDDALAQAISGSRFTVFPSHAFETFGKSIIESYAHARAVIASDLGSRRELVEEGKTGLLYPPGDIGRLRDAIAFLHEQPEMAEQMGKAGQQLVRNHYTADQHLERLTSLYQDLIQHSPLAVERHKTLNVAFIGGRGVVSKYSGIETYYEEVGRELARRGHEVTIYCRSYFTPPQEKYKGMKIVRIPTIRTKHLETAMHTLLSSLHVLFSRNRIVHYHALGPSLFSFIPRLVGKKTVVTVQGLDWQRKKWNALASAVLRAGERASATLPNATMVVSETLRKYYDDRYGAGSLCIPNGTHLRERRTPSHLSDWNLEPDHYILFLGRFSPEKNCHLLIDAYERLNTPVKLVFAGGSSYTDAYIERLYQHASDRIRFLPWVGGDELEELLTNAMLFVLPSDIEGLSLALLDAMGAGVCVVTSDIPENCELVEGAGFTFRRGDVEDLERILRRLLQDPTARQSAAQSAKERIRHHYQWPDVARRIEAVYLQLADKKTVDQKSQAA